MCLPFVSECACTCVYVCARVCMCTHARVCVCVCVCVFMCDSVYNHVCVWRGRSENLFLFTPNYFYLIL